MRHLLVELAMALLLAGCGALPTFSPTPIPTPTPDPLGDGGLLSGEPCGPPCFMNIVPGKTDETGVLQILKNTGRYETCYTNNSESETSSRHTYCLSGIWLSYAYGTHIIDMIKFSPGSRPTLAAVLKQYGDPDGVMPSKCCVPDQPNHSGLTLLYDRLGMILDLQEQPGVSITPAPGSEIATVTYWEATAYQNFRVKDADYIVPWQGYIEYKDPHPLY
jgi:hypothetical protein